MNAILEALARHSFERPDAAALSEPGRTLGYGALWSQVQELAAAFSARGLRGIGLLADNGLDWALADLAAMQAGVLLVPLPPFFSERQRAHAIRSSGIEALLVSAESAAETDETLPGLQNLRLRRLPVAVDVALPAGTQKITYTSGSTGEPKGVCLGAAHAARVAAALCEASGAAPGDVHLAVLPLSSLLENIGGLYAPLLAGATARLWPMRDVGLSGATQCDPQRLLDALWASRASSTILVPQMLLALVQALEQGAARPPRLRFIAVGGASVSPRLLARAQAHGLPVFEGYGLSECASVVALNRPGATRTGTVGRPLPHLRVHIAGDGEVRVSGNGFLGYVGEPSRNAEDEVATGDLGSLDAEGYLVLSGRKKNLFVTAFGRNVSPEWVERELGLMPAIAQVAVFGEARPWNAAVIVPRGPAAAVNAALAEVNAQLPDYARVQRWVVAHEPFTPANDQLTANGRLRRARIAERYSPQLEALYEEAYS